MKNKKTEINFSVIHYLNRIRLTQTNPNILLPPHAKDMQRNILWNCHLGVFGSLSLWSLIQTFNHVSKENQRAWLMKLWCLSLPQEAQVYLQNEPERFSRRANKIE